MQNIKLFLAQNSNVQLLSDTIANQQKGGRRFVTTDYHAFVSKWSTLNAQGEGHNMSVKIHGGTYCIEW